jgi:hypothetical protein
MKDQIGEKNPCKDPDWGDDDRRKSQLTGER